MLAQTVTRVGTGSSEVRAAGGTSPASIRRLRQRRCRGIDAPTPGSTITGPRRRRSCATRSAPAAAASRSSSAPPPASARPTRCCRRRGSASARASTSSSASSRRTAGPRPRRCSPASRSIPRRRVDYRGHVLEEMDLDAILARRPAIVLVDELAHTNAPGSRHPKRWSDVEELLDAGIEVYTTRQHPAPREPERRRRADHRRARPRDRAGRDPRARRRDQADRPLARGPDPAPARGQGLRPAAGRARDRELLQPGQPDRAARARAAPHRRARRRGDAHLHARARRRRHLAGRRARHGRASAAGRSASVWSAPARRMAARRHAEWIAVFVETPAFAPRAGGAARDGDADAAPRRAARRRGRDDHRPRRRRRAGPLRAAAQRQRADPREVAAIVVARARPAGADRRGHPPQRRHRRARRRRRARGADRARGRDPRRRRPRARPAATRFALACVVARRRRRRACCARSPVSPTPRWCS